jgi:uncharacterized membrane protein YccC
MANLRIGAEELVSLIDRARDLRAHVEHLSRFQARDEKLSRLLQTLQPVASAATALRRESVGSLDIDDRLQGLASQVRRVKKTYEEDKDKFLDPNGSGFRDLERTVEAFVTDASDRAKTIWRDYVDRSLSKLDAEVLRVLGKIPSYAVTVDRLHALNSTLDRLREEMPTAQVCAQFGEVVAERQDLWEDMRGTDFSQEVLEFLRAASTGGAAVNTLTPTVLDWLQNHGLVDSFRVTTVRRPSE